MVYLDNIARPTFQDRDHNWVSRLSAQEWPRSPRPRPRKIGRPRVLSRPI